MTMSRYFASPEGWTRAAAGFVILATAPFTVHTLSASALSSPQRFSTPPPASTVRRLSSIIHHPLSILLGLARILCYNRSVTFQEGVLK
jgi:hypothetical protein